MNDFNRSTMAARTGSMDMSADAGLRQFMLGVYNKLALGIFVAGVLAFLAGTWEPLTNLVFGTPLYYVVAFAPPVLIIASMFLMRNPSPMGSGILYWAIVSTIGLGLGVYFYMASSGASFETRGGITQALNYATIAKAFLITSIAFGGLSLFGYTTKRDLSGVGAAAIMAVWGLFIVAMLYMVLPMIFPNVAFLQPSSGMEWLISGGFALLSAVLVAWQTQELKEGYYQLAGDGRSLAVMTNWGALNFFIMFVNMFRFVLMLLSSRD